MKTYRLEDVEKALIEAGIRPGDLVFVQSALYPLGKLEGCSLREAPERLLDIFLKVVGPHGTLGVPTFNFDFCKGLPFNRQKTPSKMMGALSEVVRLYPGSVRSRHALQSTAFVGALAEDLTSADPSSGYGPGSPFDLLLSRKAKLILLGGGFTAAYFIHYVEERVQVPYRYWKAFTADYSDQGQTRSATYQMYVRRLDINTDVNEAQIEDWMIEEDRLKKVVLGGEYLRVCEFTDFLECAEARLRKNPYVLLRNPPAAG